VIEILERLGCVVAVIRTRERGDAERLARAADPSHCDLVVAAGGDGTINEVINGLAENLLPLALLPLGTANVLAAEVGLDGDARAVAEAIAFRPARPVFLGTANGRRFALMVGVGFDARVVEELDLTLKRAFGKAAYALSALGQLISYRSQRYHVEIGRRRLAAAAIVVAKGHYYGGRFVIAARARLEEPRLYVAIFERPGRWNLVRYGFALITDRLDRLPDVVILPATELTVHGPDGEAVHADGDLVASLPLSVALAERPLSLVTAG
jgi:diacylglycerol kinase (ATP)